MRSIYVLILVACCGCGSYFTGMGHNAATGAIDASTTDDAKKKLSGLTTKLTADATKAARDEALSPETNVRVQKLVTDATKAARDEALSPETDARVQRLITDSGATAKGQLEALTTVLQARLQQSVRGTIDELGDEKTLAAAGALREELAGPPLQKDVNDLIDAAAPHLAAVVQQSVQASLGPIKEEEANLKNEVDQEASKWKPIAIGFGVGSGFLVVCLIFAALMLRHHKQLIESHQKTIAMLVRQRDPLAKES